MFSLRPPELVAPRHAGSIAAAGAGMAIGEAWWDTMRECRVQLDRGEIAASRQRLRTLFRCIQAAAEPEVLDLLDAEDRIELQRLARVFKALWRRAQQFWALRN